MCNCWLEVQFLARHQWKCLYWTQQGCTILIHVLCIGPSCRISANKSQLYFLISSNGFLQLPDFCVFIVIWFCDFCLILCASLSAFSLSKATYINRFYGYDIASIKVLFSYIWEAYSTIKLCLSNISSFTRGSGFNLLQKCRQYFSIVFLDWRFSRIYCLKFECL